MALSLLTKKQADVLEFIKTFIIEHGYPPTRSETADNFEVNRNAIQGHILALIKKGALSSKEGESRTTLPVKGFRVRVKGDK